MTKVLDMELHGDCFMCDFEDGAVWVFIDAREKGHLLCKDCIETLVAWGLIEKPGFELKGED